LLDFLLFFFKSYSDEALELSDKGLSAFLLLKSPLDVGEEPFAVGTAGGSVEKRRAGDGIGCVVRLLLKFALILVNLIKEDFGPSGQLFLRILVHALEHALGEDADLVAHLLRRVIGTGLLHLRNDALHVHLLVHLAVSGLSILVLVAHVARITARRVRVVLI